jgi:hypothetical protein
MHDDETEIVRNLLTPLVLIVAHAYMLHCATYYSCCQLFTE